MPKSISGIYDLAEEEYEHLRALKIRLMCMTWKEFFFKLVEHYEKTTRLETEPKSPQLQT